MARPIPRVLPVTNAVLPGQVDRVLTARNFSTSAGGAERQRRELPGRSA